MTKEVTCQQCNKTYWDDLAQCPRCGHPRGAPSAPASLEDQIATAVPQDDDESTSLARRSLESDMTMWPSRRGAEWDNEQTVYEQVPTGLMGWLIVMEGSRRGQAHPIQNGTTIGRDAAKLVIRDAKMSRPHARFTVQNDQFVLWDFGSANGTYVNGERIDRATPLNENDVIKMGDTVFVLKTLK